MVMVEGVAWPGPECEHHVVGQEVLPRYDQPTNLHQIKHDQEVVNTDPASDQHHSKATTLTSPRVSFPFPH